MTETEADAAAPRREPFFKLPGIILLLLALMVIAYAVLAFASPSALQSAIDRFALVPSHYLSGSARPDGIAGLLWPFITHLFLHGNLTHLAFNSLWLMAVGTPLARRLGAAPFLGFYFFCGICGALAHLLSNSGSDIPVVGASGAIAGCMAGALRVMFSPNARYFTKGVGIHGELAPLMDRRILVVSITWLVLNFVLGSGLLPLPGTGGAGIAWEAHVGGFFAGMLFIPIFDRWAGGGAIFPGRAP